MWAGSWSLRARSRAVAKVCSSDWEIISQIFPCFRQEPQQIGGNQAFFTDFISRQVTGEAVEIDRQAQAFNKRSKMFLSKDTGNHSGENVSRAAGRHPGIPGGIDVDVSIRRGHDRSIALENDIGIP